MKLFKKETSYIIPTNQTKSTIVKAMFEKRTTFSDSLFYDISAWTFPLAFNLDYAELKTTQNIGDVVQNVEFNNGEVTAKSTYAYLMEWHEYYTPKALNKILQKDIPPPLQNFCNVYGSSKCNDLTNENCKSSRCCILLNNGTENIDKNKDISNPKCVGGSANGPTFQTDADSFYYMNKLYPNTPI